MKEIYDIVIIGGGTNGLSIASYLGKCGLSVCICEDRCECGGGAENTEPIPGVNIDPHATYLYGGAAPAFEQLELHKFGFRMVYMNGAAGGITSDGKCYLISPEHRDETIASMRKFSQKDADMFEMLYDIGDDVDPNKIIVEILRSIYWTPPPPSHIKLGPDELPWSKVFKEYLPGLYDDEWNKMSVLDIADVLVESEPLKVGLAMGSWYNGPHPSWKGCGIPGIACNLLLYYSHGTPRGGMHSYAHSLVRCALYHGAKIYTNSRVEEIIVEDGEAKGVILADDAHAKNKRIYASKAVLSNTHVMQTFLDLIPSRELDRDFVERVKGLNLKGGSLFVLSLVTSEMPKYIGGADELFSDGRWPTVVAIPADGREQMLNQERDVYALNTHPTSMDSMITGLCSHDVFDRTRCYNDELYLFSPIYIQVPPPEYHRDGPEAVNR
ncbi:MAG: FAD-binding protein, partial [Spirochaetota bacterium]|nr:FAD-binding protein [Spirochaetota bacterium]